MLADLGGKPLNSPISTVPSLGIRERDEYSRQSLVRFLVRDALLEKRTQLLYRLGCAKLFMDSTRALVPQLRLGRAIMVRHRQ